jgi:hypothetical protein
VVITRQDAHHTITTAIECKDTGRKVGVPAIEAFWKKCDRTGVHHRVVVSASGFTATARTKAAMLDIICMELTEAAKFDWMATDFFVHVQRLVSHINAVAYFVNDEHPDLPFKLLDANDTEMTPEHLAGIILNAVELPADIEPYVGVETPVHVRTQTIDWHGVGEDGVRYPITHVDLTTKMKVKKSSSPMTLHSYTGPNARYTIASTPVEAGEHSGKLVMIEDGEGIRVVWSPDPAESHSGPDQR